MVLLNLIGIAILKICSFKGTNDQLSAFILLQFGGRYLILARNALKSWLDWWKVWILIPYLEFRILKIRVHRKSCRAVRFVNSGSGNNHHRIELLIPCIFSMQWGLMFACMTVILTASPDRSILALDVESGTEIARLMKAHGWDWFIFLGLLLSYLLYFTWSTLSEFSFKFFFMVQIELQWTDLSIWPRPSLRLVMIKVA